MLDTQIKAVFLPRVIVLIISIISLCISLLVHNETQGIRNQLETTMIEIAQSPCDTPDINVLANQLLEILVEQANQENEK